MTGFYHEAPGLCANISAMQIGPRHVFYAAILATLLLGGCSCGIELSELTFTRTKPDRSDLVGTWIPTANTIKDMKERGGYAISNHELTLQVDGSFTMTNMPDWWTDGFGESKTNFVSGSGTWELDEEKIVRNWKVWRIFLKSPEFGTSIHVRKQKPPYLIHITLGDPDSGLSMLFERRSKTGQH